MPLVAVLVLAVAGFCVSRLHGTFGSNHNTANPERLCEQDRPVQPKARRPRGVRPARHRGDDQLPPI